MLVNLVKTQRARFAALAQSWLSLGAFSFEVWERDHQIARWTSGQSLSAPVLRATIGDGEEPQGEMRVYGIEENTTSLIRLQTDAALVTQLLQLEDELQSMTADLVASQDQLLALYQLNQSLRSQVSVEATLRSVVAESVRLSRAKAGFAVLLLPDGAPLTVHYPRPTVGDDLIWQTFWQAHALERDVLLTPETTLESLPSGIHNLFFTPIRVRGALTAGVGLINKPGQGFTAPDMKLIHALAQHSSAHVENGMLHQETVEQTKLQMEVELAQRVQLQLLPQQVPTVTGLDIFAHSRPASQVGGDFYDFVSVENRPFIFTVGDVTGKGLSAALLMTMARTSIHSKATFLPKPTPEVVMRQSNEDLYDDFNQVGMFATAFIGQYVPEQQQMLYANAGHSPVLYRPKQGGIRMLLADSTPIGVLNVSLCRNQFVPFEPGDLLVVATDGFTDVRNNQEELFGYERLLSLVDGCAEYSAHTIATLLFNRVSEFGAGRLQDDDQTLVVIKGV